MSDAAVHTHHAIDYIEFTSADLAATKAFYTAAFGWQFNDYGPEYCGIVGNGGEMGGIHQNPQASRGSGVLVVLFSDDLEASHAAVVAAGGEIVKDTFDFPGGRRFHFRDPSGNELAVWALAASE